MEKKDDSAFNLKPGLKAPRFQILIVEKDDGCFQLKLTCLSELAALHCGGEHLSQRREHLMEEGKGAPFAGALSILCNHNMRRVEESLSDVF